MTDEQILERAIEKANRVIKEQLETTETLHYDQVVPQSPPIYVLWGRLQGTYTGDHGGTQGIVSGMRKP